MQYEGGYWDMPGLNVLKVTHEGPARGDAACLPPLPLLRPFDVMNDSDSACL